MSRLVKCMAIIIWHSGWIGVWVAQWWGVHAVMRVYLTFLLYWSVFGYDKACDVHVDMNMAE